MPPLPQKELKANPEEYNEHEKHDRFRKEYAKTMKRFDSISSSTNQTLPSSSSISFVEPPSSCSSPQSDHTNITEPGSAEPTSAFSSKQIKSRSLIKAVRNLYSFNKSIPHATCLCEVCENCILLVKGFNKCKNISETLPTNPHDLVEKYACDSNLKDCLRNICTVCNTDECINLYIKCDESSDESTDTNSDDNSSDETKMRRIIR